MSAGVCVTCVGCVAYPRTISMTHVTERVAEKPTQPTQVTQKPGLRTPASTHEFRRQSRAANRTGPISGPAHHGGCENAEQ